MTIFGFCTVEQDDAPITADRRCLTHGGLVLPPSWTPQNTPFPWPARPEGYVYKPPAYLREHQERQAARPDTLARHRKPAPKKTVSASLDKKLRPPKPKPQVEAAGTYITFGCARCHTLVTVKRRGGYRPRFCSTDCRRKSWNVARRDRPPMSSQGRTCADCKQGDRPYRGHGLCTVCFQRRKRQVRKEAAA